MGLSSFLQKLLFVNQFNIADGKVELLGQRYVFLDSSYLLALQEIDKSTVYKIAKNSSKANMKSLVNHAEVYKEIKLESLKNIAELSSKIGKNEEGVIKTLQSIFDVYGLGKMEIVELNNDKKTALIKIENSSLALIHSKKIRSKDFSCSFTAGLLAGIFSFIFKKDVDCVEIKCLASNSEYCEFEVE